MYGRRKLMVLGPALLATLALGPASISYASTTSSPEPAAAAATTPQSGAASDTTAPIREPKGYWNGYRDGYRAAGQDCSIHAMNTPQALGKALQMSDYDRGWLDGYDDGYSRFCQNSG
ncbi:hypothetical protein [Streptosporangium sp. NPDC087985]|uniref:hypothetical protein n=1 Tax=Streptosporangium sp. NPDC087985 TaxID=3366196 RepID=UPI00382FC307